jgi:biopolymer transport protein ExbD
MALRPDELDDDLRETHEINVTPFIDVMLVLLVIFMVVAPLATVQIPVDLPASTSEMRSRPDKPIYLTIKADHSLAVGNEAVPQDGLGLALERASGGDKTQRIYLRADKSVAYGELITLMDALRVAGYLKVALVAVEPDAAK